MSKENVIKENKKELSKLDAKHKSKEKCEKFETELSKPGIFETAIPLKLYLEKLVAALAEVGFMKGQFIPCLCTCRDEIAVHGVYDAMTEAFGLKPFVLSCLGGMMFSGVTSLESAMKHAPQYFLDENRQEVNLKNERYVFIGMPHIGINEEGIPGVYEREGRHHSHACGALIAFRDALEIKGTHNINVNTIVQYRDGMIDPDDLEYSILQKRMFSRLEQSKDWKGEKVPTLVDVVKMAELQIFSDLERQLGRLKIDNSKNFYAVVSCIEIHGPRIIDEEGKAQENTWIFYDQIPDYVMMKNRDPTYLNLNLL